MNRWAFGRRTTGWCALVLALAMLSTGGGRPCAGQVAHDDSVPSPDGSPGANRYAGSPPPKKGGPGPTEHRGGPDEYGYVFVDSTQPDGPRYQWIELIGDPEARVDEVRDESRTPELDLGFAFAYYWDSEATVHLSALGTVILNGRQTGRGNECEPWPDPPYSGDEDLIAVFWDALDPCGGWLFAPVYSRAFAARACPYDGYPGACFVGEWDEWCQTVPGVGNFAVGRWEVILFDDGSIVTQYLDLGEPAWDSYSVGIQSPDDSTGVLYGCDTPDVVFPGLAIRFWAPSVVADAMAGRQEACPGTRVEHMVRVWQATGDSVDVHVNLTGSSAAEAPAVLEQAPSHEWVWLPVEVTVDEAAPIGAVERTSVEVVLDGDPGARWTVDLETEVSDRGVRMGRRSPRPHRDSAAVLVHGSIYVFGDYDDEGWSDAYDIGAGEWRELAPMPEPDSTVTDAIVGVDADGETVIRFLPSVNPWLETWMHTYHVANDSWSLEPVPPGLPQDGLFAHDVACDRAENVCYITGGTPTTDIYESHARVFRYEVATGTVTELPEMTTARSHPATWLWRDMLCVAGGSRYDPVWTPLASTQCFDLDSGQWRPENADLPPLPETRWGMADGLLWLDGEAMPAIVNGVGPVPWAPYPVRVWDGSAWLDLGMLPEYTFRMEGVAAGATYYLPGGVTTLLNESHQLQILELCGNGTADVWVDKTVEAAGGVSVGDRVVYRITAGNNGPERALGVEVVDELPEGLEVVGDTCGGQWYGATRQWVWTVGDLHAEGRLTCELEVEVGIAGEVVNEVVISAEGEDPEPGNEVGSVAIEVRAEPIPTVGVIGAALFMLMLAWAGIRRLT